MERLFTFSAVFRVRKTRYHLGNNPVLWPFLENLVLFPNSGEVKIDKCSFGLVFRAISACYTPSPLTERYFQKSERSKMRLNLLVVLLVSSRKPLKHIQNRYLLQISVLPVIALAWVKFCPPLCPPPPGK